MFTRWMGGVKMKVHKRLISTLILVTLLIGIVGLMAIIREPGQAEQVFYVVPKSIKEDFTFWQNVLDGASIAGDELGIQLKFAGTELETDVEGQIDLLEEILLTRPRGIVLASTDQKALAPVCKKIIDAGVTLVFVDSDVEMETANSVIATDNLTGAKDIGKELAKKMEYQGRVAVFSHVRGTSTAIQREYGFREEMGHYKDIDVIEATYFSDGEADIAYELAMELLDKEKDIDGIFATNEKTAIGVGRAIKELGLTGKIIMVGFDAEAIQVSFIEEGIMYGSMVQRPFNMGYLGVYEAYKIANDKKEPEYINTGAVFINKDNLFTGENQKLLFPFVK